MRWLTEGTINIQIKPGVYNLLPILKYKQIFGLRESGFLFSLWRPEAPAGIFNRESLTSDGDQLTALASR